jgi:CRP-like cAMP-binding protein
MVIMSAAIEDHLSDIRSHRIDLRPGQYLFHLADPVRAIHVVRDGWVHLVRHQTDGSLLVLQRAGAGSVVAEASLYSESYHCDAVAPRSAQLLAFGRADIQQRLRGDPDFAETWASHLTRELQRARLHAEILSLKTVARRLDAWMAWRGGDVPARGDWKMVAGEIGVSPEALYREIAKRRVSSG